MKREKGCKKNVYFSNVCISVNHMIVFLRYNSPAEGTAWGINFAVLVCILCKTKKKHFLHHLFIKTKLYTYFCYHLEVLNHNFIDKDPVSIEKNCFLK